jgi:multisubunit Na+/H+ antiporter MnhF subunit
MTIWLLALLAMLPPLVFPLWVAIRGDLVSRLVAIQLGSAVTSLVFVLMSFAFDQSSEIDLPITLSLLSLPGTLMLTLFLERWL